MPGLRGAGEGAPVFPYDKQALYPTEPHLEAPLALGLAKPRLLSRNPAPANIL